MFGNLGMTELIFILAIALIIFGPRKLPQLGRTLGESLAQFRRASEDFKHTWEQEITVEEKRLQASTAPPSPTQSEDKQVSQTQAEPPGEAQNELAEEG